MLVELVVSDLGVIDQVSIDLAEGLIALTGETGAGKTLMVDAINLLVGGRADPGLVRSGAEAASVDGRFVLDGEELILSRIVPASGRSRAYINGRPVTAGALAELGERLIDLHGQHDHQSLLRVEAQRASLDTFGNIDLIPLNEARAHLSDVEARLSDFGGNPRDRARELDLIRYQLDELDAANLSEAEELDRLAETEDVLANSLDYKTAASRAIELLAADSGDSSGRDVLAKALVSIEGIETYAPSAARLANILAEVDDLVDEVRTVSEAIQHNPQELAQVRARRQELLDLCRKYGADLATVMDEHRTLTERHRELASFDERAAELDAELADARVRVAELSAVVAEARALAAPKLAAAIESHLPDLAMPKARVGVSVEGVAGSDVSFLLAANPGSSLAPLAKVASGGELARTMLALRSVLSDAPPILVFDEVDAGIGGEAGLAVGRALANLGGTHQVLVVTHLAQIAAYADTHLVVEKVQGSEDTVSRLRAVDGNDRVLELARMLSGQPESVKAQDHAASLLEAAR